MTVCPSSSHYIILRANLDAPARDLNGRLHVEDPYRCCCCFRVVRHEGFLIITREPDLNRPLRCSCVLLFCLVDIHLPPPTSS